MDKFLVIDGSSLLHRAFFALPPLTNSKGIATGAVYGLMNMLVHLLQKFSPRYLAVAFDKSRHTFRSERYSEYKAQRKPTPPELSTQFTLAREVLTSLGMAVLELDNYEADDIIGTLATANKEVAEVYIVTGDRDELQLIDENVKVCFTQKGTRELKLYDKEVFAAEYDGLMPRQLIDLKGLMGDSSDNIPGVKGIGEKTALKLIKEYASVEEVLARAESIAAKGVRTKLTSGAEQALLSKELATICLSAPVATDIANFALQPLTYAAQEKLQEVEFRTLYEKLVPLLGEEKVEEGLFAALPVTPSVEQITLKEEQEISALLASIYQSKEEIALSYTVTGSLPHLTLSTFSLYWQGKVYHLEEAQELIGELLSKEEVPKTCVDAKELAKIMLCQGGKLQGIKDDLMLAAYLYEPGLASYGLRSLSERYLGRDATDTAQDVARLAEILMPALEARDLTQLYREVELPLAQVLADMEYAGIKVDVALLERITEQMREQVASLEEQAVEVAGEKFNLKSPKQLGAILFDKLKLPIIKKTKSGYSTDVSVLEQLSGLHPLVDIILEHRKLSKLLSTYLEGFVPLLNSETGRVHTHFQQAVTVTGRLSSTEPNLQNIPTRTEEGKRLRQMFVPGEGYDYLLSCDYSQVELRVLAHVSLDTLLLDSFATGQDVHRRTAAEVFGVELDSVTPLMRSRAKAVNFGIVYGISDFGLSQQLKISRKEAKRYIDDYFARYTGVKAYMEQAVATAREKGYVTTLLGRRRYLPDIKSSNYNQRSFAERTAINTPIQGTAADIIKIAMIRVSEALHKAQLKSRILLQVHDELVLEVTKDELMVVASMVKEIMEKACPLKVPLTADVAWGSDWAEAK